MTRIVICGGPRTGKTTLARKLDEQCSHAPCGSLRMTDDLIAEFSHMGVMAWSGCSQRAAEWLDVPGPWIIEGVAMSRALRKWREAHPGEPPPVDRVIRLTAPYEPLSKGQAAMAKGEETVWREIEDWISAYSTMTCGSRNDPLDFDLAILTPPDVRRSPHHE